MRQNDDGETVRAMDVLMPGIGEVIGGSQREERLDYLMQRMREMDISQEELGGSHTHTAISGTADFKAKDDVDALEQSVFQEGA